MIKWAELIPVICGNYSIGLTYDDNGLETPCLYDTKEEVLAEIEDMNRCYQEQIKEGERDEGDEWEGEPHRVWFSDNQQLFVVDDNDEPIEEIDWKAQL